MPVSRRRTILDDLRIGDEKRAYGPKKEVRRDTLEQRMQGTPGGIARRGVKHILH